MSEFEILAESAIHHDRTWSIVQYWTSVTFGLFIAAHIAAARVHVFVLASFLILYVIFSVSSAQMFLFDIEMYRACVLQLKALADSGETLSLIGQTAIEQAPALKSDSYGILFRRLGLGGTFFAAIVYPIYCHRTGRRKERFSPPNGTSQPPE